MADEAQERVTDETKQAERAEAHTTGGADRPPTEEEAERAEQLEVDPDVAESFEDAAKTGANTEGEGRID